MESGVDSACTFRSMPTDYHAKYWATELTLRGPRGSIESLTRSIAGARVDLNPHQVDAALFALRSPMSRGVVLADEVGLGKTIEAGIVIAQRWAERRRHILLVVPATLRTQWQSEIESKFFLPTAIVDARRIRERQRSAQPNLLTSGEQVVIASYNFVAANDAAIKAVPWDLVVWTKPIDCATSTALRAGSLARSSMPSSSLRRSC